MSLFKRSPDAASPKAKSVVGHSLIWSLPKFSLRQYGLVVSGLLILAGGIMLFAANSSYMPSGDAGAINMILGTGSGTDPYTNPSPPSTMYHSFFQQFFRGLVYDPFWEQNLSWFPNAWVYGDSYAVYNDSGGSTAWIEQHHPEWILHDASSNKLYIPYACSGGSCTQYAADFGNSSFIHYWLTGCDLQGNCDPNDVGGEEAIVAKGYKGLFVDDVNMNMDVGNGSGTAVDPIDPRTGQPMTQSAWSQYMANFMVAIRQALPNIEIVHNAVWYEGGDGQTTNTNPDPQDLDKEIQSANWIELERGIVDSGITGGTGAFGIDALFSYVDTIHSLCAQDGSGNCTANNVNVLYDSYATTTADTEYNLAGYLLTSSGQDGVSSDSSTMVPGTLWPGYLRDLGAAKGARYTWNNLLRRDFAGGLVLLNPPGGSAATVNLGGNYQDINSSGQTVTMSSVTLGPSQGAVLTTLNSPPDTTPPTVSISAPASGATVSATTTLTASAADNVAVASVQFKLDGANLGPADTTSPYTYSWDTTTASNGSHTLTAVATDTSGNTTTSSPVTVTVSNSSGGGTPGDINGDGVVNIQDLSILLSHYGTNYPAAEFDGKATVDIEDLSILLGNYGK